MLLPIPAIDLMDGQAVRLKRGLADQKTVYSDQPAGLARSFQEAGAERLHVVDLDGAFTGSPKNLATIEAIRQATTMTIEVGGGIRTKDDINALFELGINYAIVGTAAVRDRALLETLAERYGDRLIVGIDAKDGKVAIEGWVETSELDAIDFARQVEALGIKTIIYTDIATDGMLTGPNVDAMVQMCDAVGLDVIASGGISKLEDLRTLDALGRQNLIGAISGRAIYEKTLDLAQAVETLKA